MWIAGPVSSLYDFVTFFTLITVFQFGAAQFQTGLGFVPLPATFLLCVVAITASYLGVVEVVKRRVMGTPAPTGGRALPGRPGLPR